MMFSKTYFAILMFLFLVSSILYANDGVRLKDETWNDDLTYGHQNRIESAVIVEGKYSGYMVIFSLYEEQLYIWLLKDNNDSILIIKDSQVIAGIGSDVLVNIGSCIYKGQHNDNIIIGYNDVIDGNEITYDSIINEFIFAFVPDIKSEKIVEANKSELSCRHQFLDGSS